MAFESSPAQHLLVPECSRHSPSTIGARQIVVLHLCAGLATAAK